MKKNVPMTGFLDDDYKNWLTELKSKIRSAQLKAAIAVNSGLISFYWDLGKMIVEKQAVTTWGDKLIDQVAKDLKTEFLDIKGLSRTNLFYAKQFYNFYQPAIVQQPVGQLGQQAVDQLIPQSVIQIPWGHISSFSANQEISTRLYFICSKLPKTTGAGMHWPCK